MSAIRRAMMAKGGGSGSGDGYVTDGLIFRLDGINKGTTDTDKWVDLVGGRVFTEYNGANVHGTNCISLPNGEWLTSAGQPSYPPTTHTIECAYTANVSGWHIVFYITRGNVAIFQNGKTHCCASRSGYSIQLPASSTNIIKIISAADSNIIYNGQLQEASANTTGNARSGYVYIGSYDSASSSYPLKGDIYAIRIYNRLLSNAEMLQNQRVDNQRFNLGLNI